MKYIVELEKGIWLATQGGDLRITIMEVNAQLFDTLEAAEQGLAMARKHYPFVDAKILEVAE
jgi:hypothetical protein